MRLLPKLTVWALLASAAMLTGGAVAPSAAAAQRAAAAPTATLSSIALDVPYTSFRLPNGLTVIVHEDHKAPVVAVNIWYHVGSKNEPKGRSGFAHLFEHLMFNGSENADDDWFKAANVLGATELNGTTNTDRTNYFQTVPKNALDSILWLESDRMGHLLGAVTQAKLDEQRGVVQNEKRQRENAPYGIAYEKIVKATYAEEHPYGHTVIGSMEDLNAAKLDDVREWFRTWYGPSNAVLVLAGDITPAEAKAKVEKYFGDIAPGAPVSHPQEWVAKRQGTQREVAYDRVGQPRIYRVWNVPGARSADNDYLDILGELLAGDKASRLYKRLVLDEQLATGVQAGNQTSEIAGQFMVIANAKPGSDLARIERIIDEELKRLTAQGPTPAELARVRNNTIAGFVRGLERLGGFGGKSDLLARSQVLQGSPDAWKAGFERLKTATPAQVAEVGRRWLSDGDYVLQILPFGDLAAAPTGADRSKMPAPSAAIAPTFPAPQRATLGNGLKVVLLERHDVPVVNMSLIVNTGYATDYASTKPGTGSLAMDLLDEGAGGKTALQLAESLGALGASISSAGGGEISSVGLSALTPALDPALQLYADIILRPTFAQADVDRVKAQTITAIQNAKREPNAAASRVTNAVVFGAEHPYGRLPTEASVASITRADAVAFRDRWFKPNNATLLVVGDVKLAALMPKLEAAFGSWQPGTVPQRLKPALPQPKPAVYLVDKPGALQSTIVAAIPAAARTAEGEPAIEAMNNALGGSFISRLNMNLREDKHWSYGVRSGIGSTLGARLFSVRAPVQTDKTVESLTEIRRELQALTKDRRLTATELASTQKELTLGLSNEWSTGAGLSQYLADVITNELPDDYYVTYPDRLTKLDLAQVNAAADALVRPDAVTWIVVGDRAKIEAGIRQLGLGELRVVDADGRPIG